MSSEDTDKLIITLTKQQTESLIMQLGIKIEELREMQKQEAKLGNVARIYEIEETLQPFIIAYENMFK